MNKSECFKIDISIQDSLPLVDPKKKTIHRLNCGNAFSIGDPVVIDADPFLFVHNRRLYLFYEDLHFYRYTGVIKMTSTSDLKHWTEPIEITHEPQCHFSYPFVFEDDGEVYMLPETGWQHNVRLYKAQNDDLTDFKLHKILLEREKPDSNIEFDWCDSCLYKKDSTYYLFTSIKTTVSYHLQLYISDRLEGPYKEHPSSPVVSSNKTGRCAGSLLEHDGHLYRYAQDCSNTYGGQVNLLEIDELTPHTYREHLVQENILPIHQHFYRHGGHQVNFAKFQGKIIVATDAKDEKVFYAERIWRKILRTLHLSNI